MHMQPLPLTGLRVLDLSRLLPGPFASLALADLGADVIKIESPKGGDYMRWMPPLAPSEGRRSSWAFMALNTGKRSVCLDLKHPEGAALLRTLAAEADVLLESFRPGVMTRLGLDYEALAPQNPRLIYCAISGYGQTGPMASAPGHDLNYLALSGALSLGGPKDGPPAVPPVQIADISGGLWALVGILSALHARQATGRGRLIDVSMTETTSSFLMAALGPLLNGAKGPIPAGGDVLTGGQASYRTYRCRDGKGYTLAALEPAFWGFFCARVGQLGWVSRQFDPALGAELEALFASRDSAEWTDLLSGTEACAEPVLDLASWQGHPLTEARRLIIAAQDGMRRLRSPLLGPDAPPPEAAPQLGEHTREVLTSLGLDPARIDALIAAGAIAAPAEEGL